MLEAVEELLSNNIAYDSLHPQEDLHILQRLTLAREMPTFTMSNINLLELFTSQGEKPQVQPPEEQLPVDESHEQRFALEVQQELRRFSSRAVSTSALSTSSVFRAHCEGAIEVSGCGLQKAMALFYIHGITIFYPRRSPKTPICWDFCLLQSH